MCGRYLTPDESALERHWKLPAPPEYFQSYNVAPSQHAAVVRADEAGRIEIGMLTWGFQPGWAERAWINARAETVQSSKAFASAAAKRRCLVPAMGWYEWQGERAPKQPFVFHRDGFEPFAFAGIWTGRDTPAGTERSFAILTTEAQGALRAIHDRKPLIVDRSDYDAWLAPAASAEDVRRVLGGDFPGIVAYAISSFVNKPANNDARCIAPK